MDTKHKGLSHVGTENGIERFTYYLEGRRVFDVLIDGQTPAENVPAELSNPPAGHSLHVITIAMVDAPVVTRQATKGFAVRSPYGDLEMGMTYRVQAGSIRSYLHGREAHILARLFVPPAA